MAFACIYGLFDGFWLPGLMYFMTFACIYGVFDGLCDLYAVGGGWGCDLAFFAEHPYIRRLKLIELEAALRSTATTVLVVGAPHTLKTMCISCVRCAVGGGVGCTTGPGPT